MNKLRALQDIELENALRRSMIENEVVSERLRRSRVDAAIELERSRRETQTAVETALRRSRIEA